jgi:hypothetical protein
MNLEPVESTVTGLGQFGRQRFHDFAPRWEGGQGEVSKSSGAGEAVQRTGERRHPSLSSLQRVPGNHREERTGAHRLI